MVKMSINDIIIRYSFVSKILFKDGDNSLSKDLKIKIMSIRIEYGKINRAFEEDVQEFANGIIEDRFKELGNKENKTEEEVNEYNNLVSKYNNETNDYISKYILNEAEVNEYTFTKDEFNEILLTNSDNNVNINNNDIEAADFLESIYTLFVKE